jgi:hypothetical protein
MLGIRLKTTTLMAAAVALLDIYPSTKKRGARLMPMVRGVA